MTVTDRNLIGIPGASSETIELAHGAIAHSWGYSRHTPVDPADNS